jgi:acetyl esterase/lipase
VNVRFKPVVDGGLRLAALLLLSLTCWIVVPAPTRLLLPLSVGAPELSPWLALAGLALLAAGGVTYTGGLGSRTTLAASLAATALASVPLLQLPGTIGRADAAMRRSLGAGVLDAPAGGAMQPAPIDVATLFRGFAACASRVTRGLEFAAPGGVPLRLDVYQPAAPGPHPVVVQIYGGAWQRGVPAENGAFAACLAAAGTVVFAIDYRHAPRWRWPAQLEDVRTALAWIRAHARRFGGDPARLVLLGRSAGAHLAMLAAYEPGAPPVKGVVNLYGPVDLTSGYRHPPRPDPLDVRRVEEALMGGPPDDMPDRYRDASPITHVSPRSPPTLLIYGARDHIVPPRFGAALHERLAAAGAVAVLLQLPWADHAFDAVPHGPHGQLARYYIERFVKWAVNQEDQ